MLGRPPISQLWDFEIAMPAAFVDTAVTSIHGDGDGEHVAVFSQLILLSGVLERTLAATSRRPIHDPACPHSDFLSRLSVSARPDLTDEQKLAAAGLFLDEWSRHRPPELDVNNAQARLHYAAHGVRLENLSAMELTIQLILAGRRLQLATPTVPPATPGTRAVNVSAARQELLDVSRQMVALAVQLGSAGLLAQSDISGHRAKARRRTDDHSATLPCPARWTDDPCRLTLRTIRRGFASAGRRNVCRAGCDCHIASLGKRPADFAWLC